MREPSNPRNVQKIRGDGVGRKLTKENPSAKVGFRSAPKNRLFRCLCEPITALFKDRSDEDSLSGMEKDAPWPLPRPRRWVQWVNEPQTEAELAALRHCIRRGCPFGDESWTENTVRELGLESTVRPRGNLQAFGAGAVDGGEVVPNGVDETQNAILQKLAWETVSKYPHAGVTAK